MAAAGSVMPLIRSKSERKFVFRRCFAGHKKISGRLDFGLFRGCGQHRRS
jgi:hypothetical protein